MNHFIITAIFSITFLHLSIVYCAENSLENDINEVLAVVPHSKVKAMIVKYYLFDGEFREFVKYLGDKEFGKVWGDVFRLKTVRGLMQFFEERGVKAYGKTLIDVF